MSEFSQTVPELVAWARKNDFSISLPVDRLSSVSYTHLTLPTTPYV